MTAEHATPPDNTAIRVSLWRALHVEIDAKPHVLEDTIGLKLVATETGWRNRPDMHPENTSRSRASIVARTRLIEDMLADEVARGLSQYVILGAGLDTFAQRRPDLASRLTVFEVDQPGPQLWKRRRLTEIGYPLPDWLRSVPVNFESEGWWEKLLAAGFDAGKPAFVACTGVIMYLTHEAIVAMLTQLSRLAPGSTLAITFMLPIDLVDADERPAREMAEQFMRMAGTPFISAFSPEAFQALARNAGFKQARHISTADVAARYFAGRTDRLRPSTAEQMLIAST